jgi:hypothetical protein
VTSDARLEEALRSIGSELAPPAGWEDRVLAATVGPAHVAAPAPRRARWWMFAAPALACAAAAAVYLWWPRSTLPVQQLALAVSVEHGGPIVRGTTAHPGDTLVASTTGGAAHTAIWIYRDDHELVMSCTSSPCRVTLTARGDYSIVALSSDAPLPTPHGTLDDDVSAAAKSGATYTIEPVEVR